MSNLNENESGTTFDEFMNQWDKKTLNLKRRFKRRLMRHDTETALKGKPRVYNLYIKVSEWYFRHIGVKFTLFMLYRIKDINKYISAKDHIYIDKLYIKLKNGSKSSR